MASKKPVPVRPPAWARYGTRRVDIRCGACRVADSALLLDVEVSPFGGSWARLPVGWWIAMGTAEQSLAHGGLRCPECMRRLSEATGHPADPTPPEPEEPAPVRRARKRRASRA